VPREVIEKIRSNLASTAADSGWPIGASIGAAVYLTPPEDTEEAIAQVDGIIPRRGPTPRQTIDQLTSGPLAPSPGSW
jgi:hypothetical protein